MYLWFNSCASYIIAIDDVLLRMFVGSFFGLSDGFGAAVGLKLVFARSAHVARWQVLEGDTIFCPNRHNHQRMQTATHNGQYSATTSYILLLSHRSSL